MASNAIFFGWSRSVPGREGISAEHFQQFLGYLGGLQKAGTISSFETVFLTPHGRDLAGFFLIRGTTENLHAVTDSAEWVEHITRASLHLEGTRELLAWTGEEAMKLMPVWMKSIPKP